MARGGKEIVPNFHLRGCGFIRGGGFGVLAVHGRAPELAAEGVGRFGCAAEIVDGGSGIELVLDGADLGIGGTVGEVFHPTGGIEERGGGGERAARLQVMVLVGRGDIAGDLLHQFAAVDVGLEVFEALPGDVQGSVTGDEVANDLFALSALREPLREGVVAGCEDQIGGDPFAIQEKEAMVEIGEVGGVGRVGFGESFVGGEDGDADVV